MAHVKVTPEEVLSSILNEISDAENDNIEVSVLYRDRIVKLLIQHVVRGDSWVPINGSPPCWW